MIVIINSQSSFYFSRFWIRVTLYCVDQAKLEFCFPELPVLHWSCQGKKKKKVFIRSGRKKRRNNFTICRRLVKGTRCCVSSHFLL